MGDVAPLSEEALAEIIARRTVAENADNVVDVIGWATQHARKDLDRLVAELRAERTRREAAEKVCQAMALEPLPVQGASGWTAFTEAWYAWRKVAHPQSSNQK